VQAQQLYLSAGYRPSPASGRVAFHAEKRLNPARRLSGDPALAPWSTRDGRSVERALPASARRELGARHNRPR
jgi:hypothetical protein